MNTTDGTDKFKVHLITGCAGGTLKRLSMDCSYLLIRWIGLTVTIRCFI